MNSSPRASQTHLRRLLIAACILTIAGQRSLGDEGLLRQHCATCHAGAEPEGDFSIHDLGEQPTRETVAAWTASLDRLKSREMPPAEESRLTEPERSKLITLFADRLRQYSEAATSSFRLPPRRMNNREFENSVRDVLLIEDVGTHQPTDNLIGDSLHEGFDTHAETLGFSNFHLEQYIESLRKIVDATILSGSKPASNSYRIPSTKILSAHTSQNIKRPERRGKRSGFDFLDPKQLAYFEPFAVVPETGWYEISIQCTALDRAYYDSAKTGIYDDDPIRLTVIMGNREQIFDLPDDEILEIRLREWLAKGTRLRLRYPTDGLTLRGNGNFKFQNAIAGEYIKEHDPELYEEVASAIKPRPGGRVLRPESWHHWVEYWRGPRPRILGATVNGPQYESWPPARQARLIGAAPSIDHASSILRPIAERAWKREVRENELARILHLVEQQEEKLGAVEAIKEGIVAILASPSFLLLNSEELTPEQRFASKFSYLLHSTLPDAKLQKAIDEGRLNSFAGIQTELKERLSGAECDPFLRSFPYGWLELSEINFMAPDPDRFERYHRKRISEDMTNEALAFFRHMVVQDRPVTEFLSADYSFVNADLGEVYDLEGLRQDSVFRKHVFNDRRRGGLLGMGAFLTVTADSLGTSPIHRAIYVMENFLGLHPSPPPPDVKIEEPDIRSAKTIKEVLQAHRSDKTCATCHQSIDPFGWAFENFDSTGAWRSEYDPIEPASASSKQRRRNPKPLGLPIDASASFRSGDDYTDIVEFRELMNSPTNRQRFVRCFVTKLLTYANGEAPDNFAEIEKIIAKSAEHDFRTVATIAAVIDSPLFRETAQQD